MNSHTCKGCNLPRAIDHGDISLLIGVDVPEALQTVAIRESRSGGPYAVKALKIREKYVKMGLLREKTT